MARLLLFNKPFQVLSQFSDHQGRRTLANFISTPALYPAGRLDYDSEGLLLLTDSGTLQARIAHPNHKMVKRYRVQVEGQIDEQALYRLTAGITLKDGPAQALQAQQISEPALWPRVPPIRQRRSQPTSWLELDIAEGRNRQVRRMTAAVGFPTLRLVRWRVGPWSVADIAPGHSQLLTVHLSKQRPRSGGKLQDRGRSKPGKTTHHRRKK